jgi:hypothetical protein
MRSLGSPLLRAVIDAPGREDLTRSILEDADSGRPHREEILEDRARWSSWPAFPASLQMAITPRTIAAL